MEGFGDAGVEPEGAIDLAGLDQLLLQADAVAGVRDFPGLGLRAPACRRTAAPGRSCARIGRRHRQARLLHRHLEGLDVERLEAGGIGIGDVAGDGRLPRRQPAIVLRDNIEKMNGGPWPASVKSWLRPCSRWLILYEACARRRRAVAASACCAYNARRLGGRSTEMGVRRAPAMASISCWVFCSGSAEPSSKLM